MVDNEVFDVPKEEAVEATPVEETHELVEVKKKGRKPMSEESKSEKL